MRSANSITGFPRFERDKRDGDRLSSGLLPGSPVTPLPERGIDLRSAVESFENTLIRQALERTGWNKNRAARLLGLNRTTLVEMLKRKHISPYAA